MKKAKIILGAIALLFLSANGANAQDVPKKSLTVIDRGQETAVNPIKLFPNPASDYVKITFSKPLKGFSIQVFDQAGRPVIENTNWKREALDVSRLETGIYIVRFTKGRESYSEKLLVQREQVGN